MSEEDENSDANIDAEEDKVGRSISETFISFSKLC